MFTRIFCVWLLLISAEVYANEDEEETIDLRPLGVKLFGEPQKSKGSVANNSNFEEEGPYLEGDLLVPISSRNGMISESSRWKNGEVPYIIRGRYSEFNAFSYKNNFEN